MLEEWDVMEILWQTNMDILSLVRVQWRSSVLTTQWTAEHIIRKRPSNWRSHPSVYKPIAVCHRSLEHFWVPPRHPYQTISSDTLVTTLRKGHPTNQSSIPYSSKVFPLLHRVLAGSSINPVAYNSLSARVKKAAAWTLPTPSPTYRLRMNEAMPRVPQYAVTLWSLISHKDRFTSA